MGKLCTLQQHLLIPCSLQFTWFTVDHNSDAFGQLQPITILVFFGLKVKKLKSEANSLWNSSFGVFGVYLMPHSTATRFLLTVQQF